MSTILTFWNQSNRFTWKWTETHLFRQSSEFQSELNWQLTKPTNQTSCMHDHVHLSSIWILLSFMYVRSWSSSTKCIVHICKVMYICGLALRVSTALRPSGRKSWGHSCHVECQQESVKDRFITTIKASWTVPVWLPVCVCAHVHTFTCTCALWVEMS